MRTEREGSGVDFDDIAYTEGEGELDSMSSSPGRTSGDRALVRVRFLQCVTTEVLECDADVFQMRCRVLTQQLEERRREYDGGSAPQSHTAKASAGTVSLMINV